MPVLPPSPSVLKLWPRFVLYQLLFHLAVPVLLAGMLLRARKEPAAARHFSHRLGAGPRVGRGAVWIFAASLGEVRAASPLIAELRNRGHRICLTVTSPAGLAEGRRLFGAAADVAVGYAPLDLVWTVGLFLWRQRPAAYLAVESEIWPGKLMLSALAGLPRVQVNGNLVERSLRRRILGMRNPMPAFLAAYDLVLTKSAAHRARYLRAGVGAERIRLVGELKFDQAADAAQIAAGADLKHHWAPDRQVILLASSVAGEEPALLDLVETLAALPGAAPRVIWAPRSPQRFDAVATALTERGLSHARRSSGAALDALADVTVLLGDSLGEMAIWYRAADLVFVGASLVDHGGHNIVEPLALGRPVVMGPSIWGIAFPADVARAAGVLIACADAEALTRQVVQLLTRPAALAGMTAKAADFSREHLGAAERSAEMLAPLLARRHPASGRVKI